MYCGLPAFVKVDSRLKFSNGPSDVGDWNILAVPLLWCIDLRATGSGEYVLNFVRSR